MRIQSVLKKPGYISFVLLLSFFAYLAFRGPSGMSSLVEKRKQISGLQEQNATMAAENERKRQRIERLKHSRSEQELEIRERLKMIRPGERQIIVPDQPRR